MGALTLDQPHWEALTPATRDAFQLVSHQPFIERYYLAGGTGLALHFGHRLSVDLDLFSDQADAVGPDERAVMRAALDDPSLAITYDKDDTFVANWRGVGVSFFRHHIYPLARPTLLVDGIRLASVEEIGAMKLAAIMGRGTRKDLVDLYFILQRVPLEAIFEVAAVKYARVNSFAVGAIRALAYFGDAEASPMPIMLDKTTWTKIKKFLNTKAIESGRKRLDQLWQ
jgi:predicted nucleotidyltransferase component of viral defense system